ncbi:MAG: HAD family phosphatase [Fretibacterium sp.]|nr:HAD family phosphatase [Fretibacterium sp.]
MTGKNRIDTVVFDIGNVLADFNWDSCIHNIFSDENIIARVNEAMRGYGLWEEFDRGVMTDDEIISAFISHAPDVEREIRLACRHIGNCISRMDHSIPWIREVKAAGRRALYLSNYSRIIMKTNPGVLDFLPLMDGGIFSCDVHLLKPDRAIYDRLCREYSLTPSSCVFIDDVKENVEAARNFGLHAIQCLSPRQARADLQALLEPERP